jgi:hypothetical protein
MRAIRSALAFSIAVIAASRSSSAAPPEWSAAAVGGLALNDPPWAFGARAGASFPAGVYAGVTFMHHPARLASESNSWLWYSGAEGGFEMGGFPKTRILCGAGYGSRRRSYGGATIDDAPFIPPPARGSLVLWPGVAVLFPLGPAFVGLDFRLILWTRPESGAARRDPFAPSISLTAGANF